MRWTLALLASALLSSAAMAQSLQPGLDPALPQVALAPAIELPVAAVGPAAVEHQTSAATAAEAPLLPPASSPVAAITETPTSPAIAPDLNAGDQALGKTPVRRERLVRSRSASAAKVRSHQPDFEPVRAPSYTRSYETRRDLGRFHPPVF